MWFKNLLVYRLNKWDVTPDILEEKLSQNAIQACSAMEMQRLGWVAKADELIEMLIKTVDGIALTPLKTNTSPTAAMTSWLAGDDLSSVFTVDRDCELRAAGEERATVRYVRHALEAEEIAKHITAGKEATRLAMTWSDRVSFMLHDNLQLKRIVALDILKDQADGSDQEDLFDTDFAIMTGELQKMLVDVIEALGGESAPAV